MTTWRCTSPTSASHPWSFPAAAGGPAWKGLVQPPAGDERPKALSEVQSDRGQGPPTWRGRTRLPGASSRSTSRHYFSLASGSLWQGAHLLSPRALRGRPAGSSGCNGRGPGARGDKCRQNHSEKLAEPPTARMPRWNLYLAQKEVSSSSAHLPPKHQQSALCPKHRLSRAGFA